MGRPTEIADGLTDPKIALSSISYSPSEFVVLGIGATQPS